MRREAAREARAAEAAHPPKRPPEPTPEKALRQQNAQKAPLRFRSTVALISCAILAVLTWLDGLGITLPGSLAGDRGAALMCLILLLQVMLTGLDVFTDGVLALFRRKPGAETLTAAACLCACLDAVSIAAAGEGAGLPYCAAAAFSLTCALWARRFRCDALRACYRTAARNRTPYVVAAHPQVDEDGGALLKSRRTPEGFVHRCQEEDLSARVYHILTPFLLAACLVLSALAAIVKKGPFFHNLSAITAACAGGAALLSFVLPFSALAKRLMLRGAAVAGYAGAAEMGKTRRIVATDSDLFPPGTLAVGGIRVLEGAFTSKVIAYTGSLIACAGSGMAPVFTELMRTNGSVMQRVDDFACHEGGGLKGSIKGEQVLVGTAGYMHLMGVRLPQSLQVKNAVFTAVNGSLVGLFLMQYNPTGSVQSALVSLLQSRITPLFAIRDFNITPLLIRQKFRVPTDSFDFPSFVDRYRISDLEPPEGAAPAAVLAREGLGPLVEAAEGGRRLYTTALLGALLSAAGSIVGMLLMFFLCWTTAYDAASAGNLLSFLLLWLAPVAVLYWNIRR